MLATNARRLLGPARAERSVRIVVTLPTEAATDPDLVQEMLAAGMDCAH